MSYLLTLAAIRPRLPALLVPVGREERPVGPLARAYTTGGEPLTEAAGWVFLSVHRIPLYAVGPEEVLAIGLHVPLAADAVWLYGVPAAGCLLGGAVVALWEAPVDPLPVGGGVTLGYVPAVLVGVLLFRGPVGAVAVVPNLASVATIDWPIALVGYPIVFGTLGAALVREVGVLRARLFG